MLILLTSGDGYLQFITVLVVFVLVLAVTAFTTKWIADYQKKQAVNGNVEVVETARLGNNKWIQIVRIGESYKAIAVCKDTVTLLGEVPKEQIKEANLGTEGLKFRDLLDKMTKRDSGDGKEPKD